MNRHHIVEQFSLSTSLTTVEVARLALRMENHRETDLWRGYTSTCKTDELSPPQLLQYHRFLCVSFCCLMPANKKYYFNKKSPKH